MYLVDEFLNSFKAVPIVIDNLRETDNVQVRVSSKITLRVLSRNGHP